MRKYPAVLMLAPVGFSISTQSLNAPFPSARLLTLAAINSEMRRLFATLTATTVLALTEPSAFVAASV